MKIQVFPTQISSKNDNKFKTPLKKLAKFFERSRNKWKERAKTNRKRNKALKIKVRDLTQSRELWKKRAKELEKQLKEKSGHSGHQDSEVQSSISQGVSAPINLCSLSSAATYVPPSKPGHNLDRVLWSPLLPPVIPVGHSYSAQIIQLGIQMISQTNASYRGVQGTFDLFSQFFPVECPSFHTIRQWLLRYGFYELQRQKEKREDWIYILDHTIKIGAEKCLLVLGVPLTQLKKKTFNLTHQDVEVLDIQVASQSTGQSIYDTLESLAVKTGIPQQILSDHGSDVKKGVTLFCKAHSKTIYTYDITHKMARLLKAELENDPQWQELSRLAAASQRRTRQTALAFLAPPKQRKHSRFLNVDTLIRWAKNILDYQDKAIFKGISPDIFEQTFGWIEDFRDDIVVYHQMMQVIHTAEKQIKQHGLNSNSVNVFQTAVQTMDTSPRVKQFTEQIRQFLEDEGSNIPSDETLLGTSDIIESVFGKYKWFAPDSSLEGITKSVLSIPTFVSKISTEKVKIAMETTRMADVNEWCEKILTKPISAQRKEAFSPP